jgi:hypothetical protein
MKKLLILTLILGRMASTDAAAAEGTPLVADGLEAGSCSLPVKEAETSLTPIADMATEENSLPNTPTPVSEETPVVAPALSSQFQAPLTKEEIKLQHIKHLFALALLEKKQNMGFDLEKKRLLLEEELKEKQSTRWRATIWAGCKIAFMGTIAGLIVYGRWKMFKKVDNSIDGIGTSIKSLATGIGNVGGHLDSWLSTPAIFGKALLCWFAPWVYVTENLPSLGKGLGEFVRAFKGNGGRWW